jgi:hypothetical protein
MAIVGMQSSNYRRTRIAEYPWKVNGEQSFQDWLLLYEEKMCFFLTLSKQQSEGRSVIKTRTNGAMI